MKFSVEPEFRDDPWYRFLQRTWMLQQLPVALALFYFGGWSWVVWGVAVRVSVSAVGHWSITYWCHNPGPGRWRVRDACVQASNLPGLGLLTYGECWHNNHHAFPESARIGILPGETDPAAWVIERMAKLRWVWDVGAPRAETMRDDLIRIVEDEIGGGERARLEQQGAEGSKQPTVDVAQRLACI